MTMTTTQTVRPTLDKASPANPYLATLRRNGLGSNNPITLYRKFHHLYTVTADPVRRQRYLSSLQAYKRRLYRFHRAQLEYLRSIPRPKLPGALGRTSQAEWDVCKVCDDLCQLEENETICYECRIAKDAPEVATCPNCDGEGFVETMVTTWGGFGIRTQKCWMCEEEAQYSRADAYEGRWR